MTKTNYLIVTAISAILSSQLFANVTTTVTPTLGPNILGSPSTSAFSSNYLDFLINGTPGPDFNTDPTGFIANPGTSQTQDIIATSFESWRGQAPGPFAGERGNRIYFGLSVVSDESCPDCEFTLAGITGTIGWTNPDGSPSDIFVDPITPFNLSSLTYSDVRVGIDYGPDNVAGTADDIVYDSGEAGTLPVDALHYIGATNALVFGSDAPFDPAVSDQENLDTLVESFLDPVHPFPQELTAEYTITKTDGTELTASGSIFVPEPAGLQIIVVLAGFLAFIARKRQVS